MLDDYFFSEDFHEILRRYETARDSSAPIYMDCDDFLDIAEYYIDKKRYDDAERCMQIANNQHPDEKEVTLMMADIIYEAEEWNRAVTWLEKVLNLDPFSMPAWLNLTDCYIHLDNMEKALETVEYASALNPDDSQVTIFTAVIYTRTERYKEAEKLYEKYLRQYPDDDVALYHAACNYSFLEKYDKASELLVCAERVSKNSEEGLFNIFLQRTYVEARRGNKGLALKYMDMAKGCSGKESASELEVLEGHIYLMFGEKVKAGNLFCKAIADSNNQYYTMHGIIQMYIDCKCYDLAVELLESIESSIKSNDVETLTQMHALAHPPLAYCYLCMGDKQNFLKYIDSAAFYNETETKSLFSGLFPEGTLVSEYGYYGEMLIDIGGFH